MGYHEKERKDLYLTGIIFLISGGLYLLLQEMSGFRLTDWLPPCLFHKLTGLYCPGCGGTRAVVLLFTGHPLKSFAYHPLVLYMGALYFWFMLSTTIEYVSKGRLKMGMHFRNRYVVGGIILLAINFFIKNGAVLLGYGSWISEYVVGIFRI